MHQKSFIDIAEMTIAHRAPGLQDWASAASLRSELLEVSPGKRQGPKFTVEDRVEAYLSVSEFKFEVGSPEYYARICLELAYESHKTGNMAVGAVLLYVDKEHGEILEFRDNAQKKSRGFWFDHAEARAVTNYQSYKFSTIEGKDVGELPAEGAPDFIYYTDLNDYTRGMKDGVTVFSSLEPCPMCMIAIVSSGAHTSITSAVDDPGAMVLGDKLKRLPEDWTNWFDSSKLTFELLNTPERELLSLSSDLFFESKRRNSASKE